MLIQTQAIFEETPCTVNVLGPCFDLQNFPSRQLVANYPHILRSSPFGFAFDKLFLLTMHDRIMQDTIHFGTVTLGRVRVEDYLSIGKMFVCQRRPVDLVDGTWARGPLHWQGRVEAGENQRGRLATHEDARPLLPEDALALLHGILVCKILGHIGPIKSGFISFDVHPSFAIAKSNLLLLFLHVQAAQGPEARAHAFNHFVIASQQQSALRGRCANQEEK